MKVKAWEATFFPFPQVAVILESQHGILLLAVSDSFLQAHLICHKDQNLACLGHLGHLLRHHLLDGWVDAWKKLDGIEDRFYCSWCWQAEEPPKIVVKARTPTAHRHGQHPLPQRPPLPVSLLPVVVDLAEEEVVE